MKRKLALIAVFMFAFVFVLSPLMQANAVVVLSNRPWTGGSGGCSDGNLTLGLRFTVPAGDPYVLNSVTGYLEPVAATSPLAQFTLNDDAFGATQPGNVIATLGVQTLTTSGEYTFPGGDNVLDSGTSYWINLTVLDAAPCPGGWAHGTVPTGIFSYSTTVQVAGGVPSPSGPVSIEIDADVYTGPTDMSAEPVPGCDVLLALPSQAVVGTFTDYATVYWHPGEATYPPVTIDAGKSYWVAGLDESGQYYKVLVSCEWVWVEVGTVGPNYDAVWNGTPLPTDVVE